MLILRENGVYAARAIRKEDAAMGAQMLYESGAVKIQANDQLSCPWRLYKYSRLPTLVFLLDVNLLARRHGSWLDDLLAPVVKIRNSGWKSMILLRGYHNVIVRVQNVVHAF
jgi:hypothetical protein